MSNEDRGPDPDFWLTCTASSWRVNTSKPYGPSGHNRCTKGISHTGYHKDGWGNVFTLTPSFRIIRNEPKL